MQHEDFLNTPYRTAPAGEADEPLADWLQDLAQRVPALAALLRRSPSEQLDLGYFHTLREICQQPLTWSATAALAAANAAALRESLHGIRHIVITGSGSSLYAAECLALHLQSTLAIPAQSIAAGQLVTHGSQSLPPAGPVLLISLARSGDSPESYAVVNDTLAADPESRHLVITCNQNGLLARAFTGYPRVRTLILAPETCDRSLVMTSSFTNMVVAGWALASLDRPAHYHDTVDRVSRAASDLLLRHTSSLSMLAARPFTTAVFLGSGPRLGAAHEGALKLLESTAGRVHAFAETFLGLRHGPMSAVRDHTLVVCLLSADPAVRRYELDLMAELNRKRIGIHRLIVGSGIPAGAVREHDVAIDTGTLPGDACSTVLDVMAGQLLAFFRCLEEGLRPDSPSTSGIISRVVEKFPIYSSSAQEPA